MKKLIAVIALSGLFVQLTAHAQSNKAQTLLDKVSETVKNASAIKADFSLSVLGSDGATKATRKGTFYMKGQSYKVDMGSQQIICNGKTVWTYLVKNKEVQVSNYNPGQQAVSPAKLFSGSYEKEYKYQYSGTKTINGKKVAVITLTPTKSGQSFSKVLLYIDESESMITGGRVYEKYGGSYVYSISNVNTNARLSSSDFIFNPKQHPDVAVIDLR